MLTKEEFIAKVLAAANKERKSHPELRKGQSVFNEVDSNPEYHQVSRICQFDYGIDCFYDDSCVNLFLDKCYELYKGMEHD